MAQAIQEFGPFGDQAWDLVRELVKQHFGVEIAADKLTDIVDKDGFKFQYTYDRDAKLFRIQLLHWPFFTNAQAINEKIHMLCENAVIHCEENPTLT